MQPGRARGPGEHDPQDVGVLVVVDDASEVQELGGGARRVPLRQVAACPPSRAPATRVRVAELLLETKHVVASGLDAHQQAVESGDVDPTAS